jgi:chromosome segregation ATPase
MKDAFLLKLTETYEKLFTQNEEIQKVANRGDQQSKVNKLKINTMDAQSQSDRKQIDSHSESILKLESRIERISQITVKEEKYQEKIQAIEMNIKNLESKESDFINHLATIENYVEK